LISAISAICLISWKITFLNKGYDSSYYDIDGRYVKGISYYKHSHRCADGNYIAFKSDINYRDSSLTIKRVANIYNINQELKNQLNSLQEAKQDDFKSRIDSIREMLINGKLNNTTLTSTHYKDHKSYRDGRILNQNIFFSRWNATWMKSRANAAFENALDALDDFEKKFKVKSSPPAYRARK